MNIKEAIEKDLRGADYIKARGLIPKSLYGSKNKNELPRPSDMSMNRYLGIHKTLPLDDIITLLNFYEVHKND